MPTPTTTPIPKRVLASARIAGAAPDELLPPLEPEPEDPEELDPPAGIVGTDVLVALERHEVAAALAALAVDGALLLMVPLPPKLQA